MMPSRYRPMRRLSKRLFIFERAGAGLTLFRKKVSPAPR